MRRRHKSGWPTIRLWHALAIILVVLMVYSYNTGNDFIGSREANVGGVTVYRPVYGSIGCDISPAQAPDQINITNGHGSYFCIGKDCYITTVPAKTSCSLGNHVTTMVNNDPTTKINVFSFSGGDTIAPLVTGIKLKQGDTLDVTWKCYVPVTGVDVGSPNSFSMPILYTRYTLMKSMDGNTVPLVLSPDDCILSDFKDRISALDPAVAQQKTTVNNVWQNWGSNVLGIPLSKPTTNNNAVWQTVKNPVTQIQYVSAGYYTLFLYDWKPIELGVNLYTPTVGPYVGHGQLYCSIADDSLWKVESVGTNAGGTYAVPTQQVASPGTICCVNAECPAGKSCDAGNTFKCVDSANATSKQCPTGSNIECGGNSLPGHDANGKAIISVSVCNKDTKMCEASTKAVQCVVSADCPDLRDASGNLEPKTCNGLTNACEYVDKSKIKTVCPEGSCCSGNGNYYAMSCVDRGYPGMKCCPENKDVGTCMATCEVVQQGFFDKLLGGIANAINGIFGTNFSNTIIALAVLLIIIIVIVLIFKFGGFGGGSGGGRGSGSSNASGAVNNVLNIPVIPGSGGRIS